jgi:hypothetical protein
MKIVMLRETNSRTLIDNRLPVLCAALLLAVLLNGCATLSKDECRVADWRLIGYQDGVAGKSASRVGSYREACAKHAVVPDLTAYQAGREEGLLEYCRPENGYRLGESGHGYPAVCSSATEARFHAAYLAGRDVHLASSLVNRTQAQINRQRHRVRALEHDREHKLSELVMDGIKSEQRVLLLYQAHEIEAEIADVEADISDLEHELAHQQAQLDRLRDNRTY